MTAFFVIALLIWPYLKKNIINRSLLAKFTSFVHLHTVSVDPNIRTCWYCHLDSNDISPIFDYEVYPFSVLLRWFDVGNSIRSLFSAFKVISVIVKQRIFFKLYQLWEFNMCFVPLGLTYNYIVAMTHFPTLLR